MSTREQKALVKEYRELMKKAGILNKPVMIEFQDPKTGEVTKEYSNPYKKLLRYFISQPEQVQLMELAYLMEVLYGDADQNTHYGKDSRSINKDPTVVETTFKKEE